MAFMRKTASSYGARWQNTEASGLRARESAAGCSDEERTLVMALVFLVWRRKEAVQRGSASLTVAQRSGSVELDAQVWGWWNVTQWHFRAIGFDLEENTHTHTHTSNFYDCIHLKRKTSTTDIYRQFFRKKNWKNLSGVINVDWFCPLKALTTWQISCLWLASLRHLPAVMYHRVIWFPLTKVS